MITQIILIFLIWVVRLGWRFLKIAVFLAILWGAIASLTATGLPVIGDVIAWTKSLDATFFGSTFLSWVAENWLPFAVTIILLNSVLSRWTLGELSTTGGYTRIFIGTIMNYLEVATETPAVKAVRDRKWNDPMGIWKLMKEGFAEFLMSRVIGFEEPYDGRLDAKAVRLGKEARFADDVKNAVGADKPDENVTTD